MRQKPRPRRTRKQKVRHQRRMFLAYLRSLPRLVGVPGAPGLFYYSDTLQVVGIRDLDGSTPEAVYDPETGHVIRYADMS